MGAKLRVMWVNAQIWWALQKARFEILRSRWPLVMI